ncbi:MAG: lectin-like protein, partial [Planctomycetota bacterium]
MSIRLLLAIGLCMNLVASVVVAQEFNPATGHTYFRTDVSVPYFVARAQAMSVGGYPVALQDATEDQWVSTTFPGEKWIGLTDEELEGDWRWESGEPLVYTNWQGGSPGSPSFHDFAYTLGTAQGWLTSRP